MRCDLLADILVVVGCAFLSTGIAIIFGIGACFLALGIESVAVAILTALGGRNDT